MPTQNQPGNQQQTKQGGYKDDDRKRLPPDDKDTVRTPSTGQDNPDDEDMTDNQPTRQHNR